LAGYLQFGAPLIDYHFYDKKSGLTLTAACSTGLTFEPQKEHSIEFTKISFCFLCTAAYLGNVTGLQEEATASGRRDRAAALLSSRADGGIESLADRNFGWRPGAA
jgi:hypothetical protein